MESLNAAAQGAAAEEAKAVEGAETADVPVERPAETAAGTETPAETQNGATPGAGPKFATIEEAGAASAKAARRFMSGDEEVWADTN